ncbi:DUF6879 family protein [Peterkaempfera bronchialis]|uniref:DUF6879 family protein n=1 Tax=Peterkaempfera bronchialis TaxID=2126346 RepID=UPI003C2BD6FD
MGETYSSLSDQGFLRHFTEFRETAYRLETLQAYDVSYERAEFDRFLSGEPRGRFPGIAEWADMVKQGVQEGKRFQRVHVVIEPLSDYVRFECAWAYRHNVAAGEDVRIIPVEKGEWPDGLPRRDYWLFDSRVLVAMHYDPDGSFRSAESVDNESEIAHARAWRDLAVASSLAFPDYERGFDELMRERRA